MIVVEGPDGAGKSTLVGQLVEKFGFDIGKRATKNRDLLYQVTRQDTYTALAAAMSGAAKPLLWDRLFFSEMVYAPVVGRECEFRPHEQKMIRRIMRVLEVPIILCLPPWKVVQANAAKEHQMPGVMSNLTNIYRHYSEELPCYFPYEQTLCYDYTNQMVHVPDSSRSRQYRTFDQICQRIEQYLEQRKIREWQPVEDATANS